MVTLEVPRPEAGAPSRSITGRVIWVQRPRSVRELFQIGLEFEVHGNIWGIAFPPEDWFAYPEETKAMSSDATPTPARSEPNFQMPAVPSQAETPSHVAPQPTASSPIVVGPPVAAKPPVAPPAVPGRAPVAAVTESKIHLVPAGEPSQEAQQAIQVAAQQA